MRPGFAVSRVFAGLMGLGYVPIIVAIVGAIVIMSDDMPHKAREWWMPLGLALFGAVINVPPALLALMVESGGKVRLRGVRVFCYANLALSLAIIVGSVVALRAIETGSSSP